MRGSLLLLVLVTGSASAAENDRLVLTDGRQFAGQFVSLDNEFVRFAYGSGLQEMPRNQVKALYQAGQQVLPEPPAQAAPVVVERTTIIEKPVYVESCAPRRWSGWNTSYGVGFGSNGYRYSGWNVGWSTGWYSPNPWCH